MFWYYKKYILSFAGVILTVLAAVAAATEDPFIETADGPVKGGVRQDLYGTDYFAFEVMTNLD